MRTSSSRVRIVAGDVEQRLGDRQRGAQLVGGVGGEPLLLGELGVEPARASCRRRRRARGTRRCGPGAGSDGTSDPFAAIRVASVMRVSGASMRPARTHPPTSPNTSRNASAAAARGANASRRSERLGMNPTMLVMTSASGTYRSRKTHTTANNRTPASMRNAA